VWPILRGLSCVACPVWPGIYHLVCVACSLCSLFLEFMLIALKCILYLSRLMEEYGTDDPEAPLTYQVEVFMLIGQKPK